MGNCLGAEWEKIEVPWGKHFWQEGVKRGANFICRKRCKLWEAECYFWEGKGVPDAGRVISWEATFMCRRATSLGWRMESREKLLEEGGFRRGSSAHKRGGDSSSTIYGVFCKMDNFLPTSNLTPWSSGWILKSLPFKSKSTLIWLSLQPSTDKQHYNI